MRVRFRIRVRVTTVPPTCVSMSQMTIGPSAVPTARYMERQCFDACANSHVKAIPGWRGVKVRVSVRVRFRVRV